MKAHWLDEPKNVKLLWRLFLVVLAATVLAELAIALHPHFEVEALFGFQRRITGRRGIDLHLHIGDVGRRVDRQTLKTPDADARQEQHQR